MPDNRPWYAIARGREVGTQRTWDATELLVSGHPDSKHKKFKTEAEALAYIEEHRLPPATIHEAAPPITTQRPPPQQYDMTNTTANATSSTKTKRARTPSPQPQPLEADHCIGIPLPRDEDLEWEGPSPGSYPEGYQDSAHITPPLQL